jgi:hypothetical protein
MRSNTVTLVSTYTEDVLVDDFGTTLRSVKGGPAYFISKALEDIEIPVTCVTGDPMTVEILLRTDGEFGRIVDIPKRQTLPRDISDWVIVSTVLDEWDIINTVAKPKYLCVDLQGFVRDGREFGSKHAWAEAINAISIAYCIKGTKEEISFLPPEAIEQQKQKLLVITDGSEGLDLYFKGTRTHIDGVTIRGLPDTIGAGDTFFGYFVGGMHAGAAPAEAARNAVVKTAEFLQRKKQSQRV